MDKRLLLTIALLWLGGGAIYYASAQVRHPSSVADDPLQNQNDEPKVAVDFDHPQIRVPESEARLIIAVKLAERAVQRGSANPAECAWEEAGKMLAYYHDQHITESRPKPEPPKQVLTEPRIYPRGLPGHYSYGH